MKRARSEETIPQEELTYHSFLAQALSDYSESGLTAHVRQLLEQALSSAEQPCEKCHVQLRFAEILQANCFVDESNRRIERVMRLLPQMQHTKQYDLVFKAYELDIVKSAMTHRPYWDALKESLCAFVQTYIAASPKQREIGSLTLGKATELVAQFAQDCFEQNRDLALESYSVLIECYRNLLASLDLHHFEYHCSPDIAVGLQAYGINQEQVRANAMRLYCSVWLDLAKCILIKDFSLNTKLARYEGEDKLAIEQILAPILAAFGELKQSIVDNKESYIQAVGPDESMDLLIELTQEPEQGEQSTPSRLESIIKTKREVGSSIQDVIAQAEDIERRRVQRVLSNGTSAPAFQEHVLIANHDNVCSMAESYLQMCNIQLILLREVAQEALAEDQERAIRALGDCVAAVKQFNPEYAFYSNYLQQRYRDANHYNVARSSALQSQFNAITFDIYEQGAQFFVAIHHLDRALEWTEQAEQACGQEQCRIDRYRALRALVNKAIMSRQEQAWRSLTNSDPLSVDYGAEQPEQNQHAKPFAFPYDILRDKMRAIRGNNPNLEADKNISVHCLTVGFIPQHQTELQVFALPFSAAVEVGNKQRVLTLNYVSKPDDCTLGKSDWGWATDQIIERIGDGYAVAKQNASVSIAMKSMSNNTPIKEFNGGTIKHLLHSEQVFYSFLEQVDLNDLLKQLQAQNPLFQPGATVSFISLDMSSTWTSCYHCRLGMLSQMSHDSGRISFAKRMQGFLVEEQGFNMAKNHDGVQQLTMCARVLGGRFYPDKKANNKPDHVNPNSKNISALKNVGIFQHHHSDAFASGSKKKLNLRF